MTVSDSEHWHRDCRGAGGLRRLSVTITPVALSPRSQSRSQSESESDAVIHCQSQVTENLAGPIRRRPGHAKTLHHKSKKTSEW
jgi:hypothetical protein